MKKLTLEYQIVTKTYLKPTYLPTYATVVTIVTVVTVVTVVKVVTLVTVVTVGTVVTHIVVKKEKKNCGQIALFMLNFCD